MSPQFIIDVTTPNGTVLWRGPVADFVAVNSGRLELVAAACGLRPGQSIRVLGEFCLGDHVQGSNPPWTRISRVGELAREAVAG